MAVPSGDEQSGGWRLWRQDRACAEHEAAC